MRYLLMFLLLFIGCEDNPTEPSNCDIEIDGIWTGTTSNTIFSDECDCGDGVGTCENTSNDNSCLIVTVDGNSTIWDSCECDGEDEETCYEIIDEGYTCEESIITTNCGDESCDTYIIYGNTISHTNTVDGSSEGFGEGCTISYVITLVKN